MITYFQDVNVINISNCFFTLKTTKTEERMTYSEDPMGNSLVEMDFQGPTWQSDKSTNKLNTNGGF